MSNGNCCPASMDTLPSFPLNLEYPSLPHESGLDPVDADHTLNSAPGGADVSSRSEAAQFVEAIQDDVDVGGGLGRATHQQQPAVGARLATEILLPCDAVPILRMDRLRRHDRQ